MAVPGTGGEAAVDFEGRNLAMRERSTCLLNGFGKKAFAPQLKTGLAAVRYCLSAVTNMGVCAKLGNLRTVWTSTDVFPAGRQKSSKIRSG